MVDALNGNIGAAKETEAGRPGEVHAPGLGAPAVSQAVGKQAPGDSFKLSKEAQALVAKLKARDSVVRAHEAAHIAAGGGVVKGGPTYTYQHGPDGGSYAVGGEVAVDTTPVANNPQATLAKANAIQAAAMAPADPSAQDQTVATQAAVMASNAAFELAKARTPEGFKGPGAKAKPGQQAGGGNALAVSNPPIELSPGAMLDISI